MNIYRVYGFYHSFSNPIWIKLKEIIEPIVNEFNLQAYPNPNNGNFNLLILIPGINDVTINIYNNIAQLIFSNIYSVDEYRSEPINLNLAKGIYTIQGLTNKESTWIKIVNL